MTLNEAEKIFKGWKDFMEIADKFFKLMLPIPESFLPYPKETMEEALNIMTKFYSDSGDKKTANLIQDTMWGYLTICEEDEVALKNTKDQLDLMFENDKLRETLIEKLHESRDNWAKIREKNDKQS